MAYTAAVITISDKGSRGERVDTSGPALCEMVKEAGYELVYTNIIPDEIEEIKAELISCSDEKQVALILTTGGTGFSPRDVTPEATLAVVERETRGIPELMRAESLKITPRASLSRAAAGIRGKSLIINLPGSKKASTENLQAVLSSVDHGLDMLYSAGSADCAAPEGGQQKGHDHGHSHDHNHSHEHGHSHDHKDHHHDHGQDHCCKPAGKEVPSMDAWLKEAKADPVAKNCGMFLTHNGVVRESAKAAVREGAEGTLPVVHMDFSYDEEKVNAYIEEAKQLPGIYYIKVWLNEGRLSVGDDIMYVLIGGDIRPHVVDCLQTLVGNIKNHCVVEKEINE